MMMKKIFLIAMVLVFALSLSACGGSDENSLRGRWIVDCDGWGAYELELFADGTASTSWQRSRTNTNRDYAFGNWSVEGDRLSISGSNMVFAGVWTFTVSGNTLTLEGARETETFTRAQ